MTEPSKKAGAIGKDAVAHEPQQASSWARLLDWGRGELSGPTAALDARVLLLHAGGIDHASLIAREGEAVPGPVAAAFREAIARRKTSEPVAHIVGTQEFFGRPFTVMRDVLIPRPETEMLVEAALALPQPPRHILDLGTGSGCLLLTLLAEMPEAMGIGIDLSARALGVARQNAEALGVAARCAFAEADMTRWGAEEPAGGFDLIVSNPPYVRDDEPLSASVAEFEPHEALFGGPDGLDLYRHLADRLALLLAPGGTALLECGTGQGEAIAAMMARAMPDRAVRVHPDLAHHDRMIAICPVGTGS